MKKAIDLIWCISLFIIGITTIILVGSNIIGIELPVVLTRIFGIADLIALPVLVYTTVKKEKKDQK